MPRNDHIWTKKREWGSVGWVGSSTAPAHIQATEPRESCVWRARVAAVFTVHRGKVGLNKELHHRLSGLSAANEWEQLWGETHTNTQRGRLASCRKPSDRKKTHRGDESSLKKKRPVTEQLSEHQPWTVCVQLSGSARRLSLSPPLAC